MEEDEVDEACSTHRRDGKFIQNFGRKNRGENHSEDLGVDGRKIEEILKKQVERAWTGFI
jgi:hypothetical protein